MSFNDMNTHNFEVSAINLMTSAFDLTSSGAAHLVSDESIVNALDAVLKIMDTRDCENGRLIYLLVNLASELIDGDDGEVEELVSQVRHELDFTFGKEA